MEKMLTDFLAAFIDIVCIIAHGQAAYLSIIIFNTENAFIYPLVNIY